MFSRNRDDTTRAERSVGIGPVVHSVLADAPAGTMPGRTFSKEPRPGRTAGDGVSTNLALIFGTLLSSQGTDASFVLTLSGFPPGASLRSCFFASVLRFRLYQTVSRSDFLGAFQVSASAFPFPASPTLSVLFRLSDHRPVDIRKGTPR